VKHFACSGRRRLPGLVRHLRIAGYCAFAAVFGAVVTAGISADAAQFRVETVVYQQATHKKNKSKKRQATDAAKPLSRSTTYFTDNWICDVMHLEGRGEDLVLLIDRGNSSATIVGGHSVGGDSSPVACTVSFDEVLRTVAALTTVDQPPLVRFASSPNFQTSWYADGKQLQMLAEPISYRVQVIDKVASAPVVESGGAGESGESLQPSESEFARRAADYREFADWSARISATRLGGLPPAARLELNRQLATRHELPERVEVTRAWQGSEKVTFFSTHSYAWQLGSKERSELEKWKTRATGMTTVDLVTLRVGKRTTNTNVDFGSESSPK